MKEYNYKFMTIKNFANLIIKHPETEIRFTVDQPEDEHDDFEPCDWYGIKLIGAFDGDALIMGYYGVGAESITNIQDCLTPDNVYDSLKEMIHKYIDKVDYVCVDMDDVKKEGGEK